MRHPFDFDPLYAPHPSRRIPIYARNGMVAASSALASAAGLAMLRQGGNAVDAIVATAAALTVLEPTSNGLGSDAFALVWQNNALHGLNASGPAPQAISIEKVLARHGGPAMPRYGWTPVTVPGAVGAWAALSARFGKLPFATLLEPAIAYASEGYPVPPMLAFLWGEASRPCGNTAPGRNLPPGTALLRPRDGPRWRAKLCACPTTPAACRL